MKVWVDLTNSPHVLVLAPVIRRLQQQGHEVRGHRPRLRPDARSSATGSGSATTRSATTAARRWPTRRRPCRSLLASSGRFARGRGFDLAFGHGSNDITVAARLLRIPCSTMFDYEWATVQHNVNCRLAQAVVVPDVIPVERFARYGAADKLQPLPGSQGGVLPVRLRARSGGAGRARPRPCRADRGCPHAAGRVALSPLRERPLRRRCCSGCAGAQTVVLPRTRGAAR